MNEIEEAKFLLTHIPYYDYYEDGRVSVETWIENELFDGPYKMWSTAGKLLVDSWCTKGRLHGIDRKGKKSLTGLYINKYERDC